MIAYLDASAVAKLFLDEEGSDRMRELWGSELAAATSAISVVELSCALSAAVRAGRLVPRRIGRAITDVTWWSERAVLVGVEAGVIQSAAALGATHGLRALDAVHVASALVLREASPTLVSWDREQRRAAVAEGIPVYP